MTKAVSRISNLLYPLADFYSAEGQAVPRVKPIDGAAMPQPYQSLLVHHNDMTPTLEAFCHEKIHLRLLKHRQTTNALYRQVVLLAGAEERPMEFGAIRIALDCFAPEAEMRIIEGFQPLGAILREFKVDHYSRPSAFFSVKPDNVIVQAFSMTHSQLLYGRHNLIFNTAHDVLAEVVEILPPLEQHQ